MRAMRRTPMGVVALLLGFVVGVATPGSETMLAVLLAPPVLWVGLRYPEALLAAFLYAGFYKTAITLPVDITVLLAAAVILLAVRSVRANGFPALSAQAWWFVVLMLVLGVGLIETDGGAYGTEKVAHFVTLGAVAFFGAPLLIRDVQGLTRFALVNMGIGLAISAAAVIPNVVGGDASRFTAFGSNTIAAGRAASIGLIGSAVYALWRPRALWWVIPAAVLSAMALVGSGSRGPLFGAVIAFGMLLIYRARTRGASKLVLTAVPVGVASAVFALLQLIPRQSLNRIQMLLGGTPGASVTTRFVAFEAAGNIWRQYPIVGAGPGGFTILTGNNYPHNLILELAAETGIVGVLPMVVLLLAALWRALRSSMTRAGFPFDFLLLALVMSVFNASVSGDINANRLLYALMGLSLTHLDSGDVSDSAEKRVA